jgi:hypothetical protein
MPRVRLAVLPLLVALALAAAVPPALAGPTPARTDPTGPTPVPGPPGPQSTASLLDTGVSGPGAYDRPASRTAGALPAGTPLGTYPCQGYGGVDRFNPVDQVMRDVFVTAGFAPYDVGRAGDVNWKLDPYRHASWRLWLHTLRWTGALVNSYRRTGNTEHLGRAVAITRDWLRDNPVASIPVSSQAAEARAHRTQVLLCLYGVVGAEQWLVDALDAHARYLRAHYSGAWNHGLDENVALLGIGCLLGRRTYADAARGRIAAMAPVVVDAQGVSNEQSVGYHQYSYSRFLVTERLLAGCGYPMPGILAQRRARMPLFAAHATQPDGIMAQLGDTEAVATTGYPGTPTEYVASGGTTGTPPATLAKVYPAGYAFGRNAWAPGPGSTWYSLRFGPGRAIHGHNDHMSVTYYARGRLLLTEAGHVGYESGRRRDFIRSPEGHNVLTLPGQRFTAAATALSRRTLSARYDFYELTDRAYRDVPRRRAVLYSRVGPPFLAVLDRASAPEPRQFQQLWHLPKDMRVLAAGRGAAVAGDGANRLHLIQVPLPGQTLPRGSTQVVTGRTAPAIQGFVSPRMYEWSPAPVVTMTRAGTATRQLTLLVPAASGDRVQHRIAVRSDGGYLLTLRVGTAATRLRISPGGSLSL